jgi:hypothetical protein
VNTLCNRFAVVSQSFAIALNRIAIIVQSRLQSLTIACEIYCNRFTIAAQSRLNVLCNRCAIAFAIAIQPCMNRFVIALQSRVKWRVQSRVLSRVKLPEQSLCNRFSIAVQPCVRSFCNVFAIACALAL